MTKVFCAGLVVAMDACTFSTAAAANMDLQKGSRLWSCGSLKAAGHYFAMSTPPAKPVPTSAFAVTQI